MLSWFKCDPVKRITADRDLLLQKAFEAQRNGKIREYSRLTAEADKLDKKITAITEAG